MPHPQHSASSREAALGWVRHPKHPFRLLLYLEWILLGIAVLSTFSAPWTGGRRRPWMVDTGWIEPWPAGVFLGIGLFAAMGLRLPWRQGRWQQVAYTALGFGLSGWVGLLSGRNSNSFSALLLIVVIRGCLLFPWRGRLLVAGLAYGSFLLRLALGIRRIYEVGQRIGPPAPMRRLSTEQVQTLVLNLSLNSALLFGLVLIFVVLMVGALLTERQSRDRLAVAHDRLRRYALLIEDQATLQERNRIAREIHDSVGHALTAQSIQLENVALWLSQNLAQATHHLQTARQLGKDALQNVRQSVATLRAHPLQQRSLTDALRQVIQEFEGTTAIPVTVQLSLDTQQPLEQATACYRITQEALTNIAKHSHATQVSLSLAEYESEIQLNIKDNGSGFNLDQNTTGFGLQSMRERAEALGGTFKLFSQPEQGCSVQVTLPRSHLSS
ncbi:sensor histidine kinase [Synechococcales cyanobacterium C]|uniref:Oxygen sensor histidine kinase NreB n=1 Tax=Petrachloros mirabilis ULC683 TaxID=2781853 RepID=A0A8K2ACD6_9CYAN|nr:sensor histidine kinase [Petrachloros mirabilis]NCJ05224.1 sensor histidine kinase [Petrachloros mirabilis ULC683]